MDIEQNVKVSRLIPIDTLDLMRAPRGKYTKGGSSIAYRCPACKKGCEGTYRTVEQFRKLHFKLNPSHFQKEPKDLISQDIFVFR